MGKDRIERRGLVSQLPGSGQSWTGMLAAIPVQNSAAVVMAETYGAGLRIGVPTRPAWWYRIPPISWLVRPPERRVFILDELGAELWRLCDGKRTVEELVSFCAKKHKLSFHESRVSVTSYLRLLVERGALAVAL